MITYELQQGMTVCEFSNLPEVNDANIADMLG